MLYVLTQANEKYCGDLVQKKTITPNYLNHEKKYNRGEEEFVVIRDHHEPVISRELFDRARQELVRRSPSGEQKAKHSNRYCFSGKIKCGICGCSYVSRTRKRKDGSLYKAWRCRESARHGCRKLDKAGNRIGCDNRSLNEDDLQPAMMQLVKNLQFDKEALIGNLSRIVQEAFRMEDKDDRPEKLEEKIRIIGEKRQSLLELYLNRDISKADFQRLNLKYEAETAGFKAERQALTAGKARCCKPDEGLAEALERIKGLVLGMEWDDTFYRCILEKIVVKEDHVLEASLSLMPQCRRVLVCRPERCSK